MERANKLKDELNESVPYAPKSSEEARARLEEKKEETGKGLTASATGESLYVEEVGVKDFVTAEGNSERRGTARISLAGNATEEADSLSPDMYPPFNAEASARRERLYQELDQQLGELVLESATFAGNIIVRTNGFGSLLSIEIRPEAGRAGLTTLGRKIVEGMNSAQRRGVEYAASRRQEIDESEFENDRSL